MATWILNSLRGGNRKLVARLHERIANHKKDRNHKLSRHPGKPAKHDKKAVLSPGKLVNLTVDCLHGNFTLSSTTHQILR
jgi:hypothetical protein